MMVMNQASPFGRGPIPNAGAVQGFGISGATIQDLTIHGNVANNPIGDLGNGRNGLLLAGCSNINVQRVSISDFATMGILVRRFLLLIIQWSRSSIKKFGCDY
jgi:hypothetical protein